MIRGMTTTPARTTPPDQLALAHELVETVSRVLGSQPGCRVTHEDGIVMAGTFTATPRARELTRAAHMQGDPVRVTVRFSNGFPDPTLADSAENNPRGMAVKFYLPDGSTTDLVCQDWPVFPAGTPEDFRDLIAAQGEGEEATERFLAEHPDVAAAGAKVAAESGRPPLSWATMAFHSMNAFKLVNAEGAGQFVRYRLVPEKGEHSLPEDQRATADPHYLHKGVLAELPIRYRVTVQLAADEDQTVDASKAWPAEREWADLGLVEITGLDEEREREGDVLVNDPMRLTDGIEPSDDPILRIRPLVYAESVRRRTGG
jgi:catalase